MVIDIHARAPSIALTPLIILRWMTAMAQLMFVMAADALFSIQLPFAPLLCLIGASVVANIYAMMVHKRRQVPEEIVRLHIIFDILQFTGILFFTGGTQNPFCILLLAPLAMAASLLSLYSLCLLIMLTVLCVSILSYAAIPLNTTHPIAPFSSDYQKAS